jgi:hypothetical protein
MRHAMYDGIRTIVMESFLLEIHIPVHCLLPSFKFYLRHLGNFLGKPTSLKRQVGADTFLSSLIQHGRINHAMTTMSQQPPHPPTLTSKPLLYPGCCLTLSTTLLTHLYDRIVQIPHNNTPNQQQDKLCILSVGSGTSLLEALLQRYLDEHQHHESNVDDVRDSESPKTTWKVDGVEVYSHAHNSMINYLPKAQMHIVPNTAELCPRAFESNVRVWMFVYPRKRELVGRYIDYIIDSETAHTQQRVEIGAEQGKVKGEAGYKGPSSTEDLEKSSREESTAGSGKLGVEMIIWAGPRSDWEDYCGYFEILSEKGWEVALGGSKNGEGNELDVGVMAFESVASVQKIRD